MADQNPAPEPSSGPAGEVRSVENPVAEAAGGKRKRGRPARGPPGPRAPVVRKSCEEEEDVCFICFDGGSLVLCDRRGCPKAYHPACIKRDEAFFRSKAKWNCGWHICSRCEKAAHHMCYTCTYSLCKVCIKDEDYVCVRGDKGFCKICMKTIMLIENNGEQKEETAKVDFDDKGSWEYLFKVYWLYLKGKLSLTLDELIQAKNPWKMAGTMFAEALSPDVQYGANVLKSFTSDISVESKNNALRKTNEPLGMEEPHCDNGSLLVRSKEWATKELLEFVAYMKNGDTSPLSQSEVQELLLEYIKRNNLRDPRRKINVICDLRLKNLFHKSRVGHYEMMKLLELHFLVKEHSQLDDVASFSSEDDPDWGNDDMLMTVKDTKRRTRQKAEVQPPQNNLGDYAAIDVHNITLINLRSNWMESLLEDFSKFQSNVVGSIVRIKISGCDQKQDTYRLVQVVGTCKIDVPYKFGNRLVDVMLEVLNLVKKETISINEISSEEISEEECRCLRQSIRCGLIKRFTVGEIQEKAVALQSLRLSDWIEAEISRLNNLRDQASEKGLKKEVQECVEKIQLLKTPEERERRLSEIPVVHADPKMNPSYESEEDDVGSNNKKQGENTKPSSAAFGGKRRKSTTLQKRATSSIDNGRRPRKKLNTCEETKTTPITYYPDKEGSMKALGKANAGNDAVGSSSLRRPRMDVKSNGLVSVASVTANASQLSISSPSMGNIVSATDVEGEKMWHYRDPNGKVQGPFSIVQLQHWSTTGYFPSDMRIWANKEDASLLLTDALKGQFHTNSTESVDNHIAGSSQLSPSVVPETHEKLNSGLHLSNHEVKSSGWNSCALSVDSNAVVDSVTELTDLSKQNGMSTPILHCPSPKPEHEDSEAMVAPKEQPDDLSEQNGMSTPILHCPSPKPEHEDSEAKVAPKEQPVSLVLSPSDSPSPSTKRRNANEAVQVSGNQQSVPSEVLVNEVGPTLSSASNPVVDEIQLPDVAREWGGYTPVVKASAEGWDSRLVSTSSVKPLEDVGDQAATQASDVQIIHSSPSQPASTISWHAVGEPIEFSTLAEESVSDLLAEVDAMESQCGGLTSPTSKRNCDIDFLHGSIEEFSPAHDQGTRSDGFSSTGDIQFPCQPTLNDELGGGSGAIVFDFVKCSTVQPAVIPRAEGETKSIVDTDIALRPATQDIGIKWAHEGREMKFPDITMCNEERVSDLHPEPLNEEVAGETKSSDVNGDNEQDCQPNMVDLNIAQKAVSEGFDLVWDASETDHGREGTVTGKQSSSTAFSDGPGPLSMGLDCVDPKTNQRTESGVPNKALSSTTNHSRGTDVMVQKSSTMADIKGQTKSSKVSDELGEEGEFVQPLTNGTELVDLNIAQVADNSWGTVQANENLNLGRSSPQGNLNFGRSSPKGSLNLGKLSAKGDLSLKRGDYGSARGLERQPRYEGERYSSPRYEGERYSSPRDRPHQGDRYNRSSSGRQQYGGRGGGGSSSGNAGGGGLPKLSHNGQRVCKFYETGRCKKGASCTFFHRVDR